jgi:aminopeptidase N
MYLRLLPFLLSLFLLGCNSKKIVTSTPIPIEYEQLDTLVIKAEKPDRLRSANEFVLPSYKEASTRTHDLLHMILDVGFNWEEEEVLGLARLQLTPYFYPSQTVVLDAKGFDFHQVQLSGSDQDLQYEYDGQQIEIQLDKTYSRQDTFELLLKYTARPRESGGSAAITSDQGLFFINPRNEIPDKPQQIWTQGETEHNSRWFPTIDKPNERCTQELFITVEDRFKTLSNGILTSSQPNDDGTRTDHWVMDLPHAPYLCMIAVGEFAVVKETWKDIPVEYFVEEKYRPYAKRIFRYTPEMLTFFSDKLQMDFPWQKYAQIIVRDYVSGAMENTTAVIFGTFIQGTDRQLIDDIENEKIVAHELFHHWFGDLVTCESWANLTLNEGFANYSEYLWLEHQYGRDAADYHWSNELNDYIFASGFNMHPLIHYGYDDKEDMFDRHSYNKGGLVLHMLRNYLGEEAFWASLNFYLNEHAFTEVEADELRLAFEEVTGQDLNWFFNQWYFEQGQPELEIQYEYINDLQEIHVTVEQKQNPDRMPAIFILPTTIDIYVEGQAIRTEEVMVNQREQTFVFSAPQKPALVQFDGNRVLLCERKENKTIEEYVFQYHNGRRFMDRYDVLRELETRGGEEVDAIFEAALDDPFWGLRRLAVLNVELEENVDKLMKLAKYDPHSQVRASALTRLAYTEIPENVGMAKYILQNDSSIQMISGALNVLNKWDQKEVVKYAKVLEDDPSLQIQGMIAAVYMSTEDPAYMPYFEKQMRTAGNRWFSELADSYAALAGNSKKLEDYQRAGTVLYDYGLKEGGSATRRIAAVVNLNQLYQSIRKAMADQPEKKQADFKRVEQELIDKIEAAKANETDPDLKKLFAGFPKS